MSTSRLNFRLEATATGSRARAATFRTLHNEVKTPLFMPVGTQATVKAQTFDTLLDSGSQILLANTYHLLLRPGPEVFRSFGGIHQFTGWEKSFLTDSGGFQIFSLPHARNMKEEGAEFRSYVDGKTYLLSPETSIGTQVAIGSDIMMVLDQCIPSTADKATAKAALDITHRWAIRSLKARGDSPQSMFAIVQGALYPDLRKESADGLIQLPFDGFAIGGLAVGEGKSEREDTCEIAAAMLPADKPRYLMGVGTPLDLLEAVHRGVDMFDCIIPNKVAQFGTAYTSRGILQLRRSIYKFSEEKLDPKCRCPVCAKYSRGYLHHLTKTQEPLGWTLLGQHNIFFYHQMMREIRQSILDDTFLAYYHERRQILQIEDMDNPAVPPKIGKERRPRTLGDYEVHIAEEGFASIRQISSGEIMHSHTPPMVEAKALYVDQSDLAGRLALPAGKQPEEVDPLIVWDIGLGAAANAMAAIQCYEAEAAKGPVRRMRVISFENDLDSLKLALTHKNRFEYLRHSGPDAILARQEWTSRQFAGLSWELRVGDFWQTVTQASAKPDLIFFDFFSHKTDTACWTLGQFQRLIALCDPRKPAELFTYSASTAVRVALLNAGFHVAIGTGTGVKKETIVALTPGYALPCRYALLTKDWLEKWRRSSAKFPEGISEAERGELEKRIEGHPQFSVG
ncbi:MAG: tRNA guanosine(34) transglycosylase Tgt, partial [Verrucomicrobia bacterium]|nr:tRNA guanosine(34) transglycosylase Tgt [Verrucomicrobiota bacterium]